MVVAVHSKESSNSETSLEKNFLTALLSGSSLSDFIPLSDVKRRIDGEKKKKVCTLTGAEPLCADVWRLQDNATGSKDTFIYFFFWNSEDSMYVRKSFRACWQQQDA